MRLTSLRIKNYGCLADFELTDIPPLAIFVGANGSGKSTLFDIFAFLRDALRDDIPTAVAKRGGFHTLRTRNATAPIQIELHTSALTYTLSIDNTPNGPYIRSEQITTNNAEKSLTLLDTELGGQDEQPDTARLRLDQPDAVVLDALRAERLSEADEPSALEAVRSLRALLRGPYFPNVDLTLAKQPITATAAHRLSECGDNLANAVKHQATHHPEAFEQALRMVQRAVPGVQSVRACDTIDGRVAIEFVDSAGGEGTFARHVSDGTIKLLAYALLLHEPQRHPLLCIEEPDSRIYPSLMWDLLEEIRAYTVHRDAQVFVTTHRTELLNPADPDEVFWLTKDNGASVSTHASDNPQVVDQHDFGDQLGRMWRSGGFDGAHPNW